MAATRIFRVAVKLDPAKPAVEHLVRAGAGQQAQNHVTKGMITCEVAEAEDIYRLAQAGVRLQDATASEPAPAAPAAKTPTPKTK